MSLKTVGTEIQDSLNNTVILNGVSTRTLFGYVPDCYTSINYTASDMTTIRSHDLNLVRLDIGLDAAVYGVSSAVQTPTQITYHADFFSTIDAIVAQAATEGLYVNLCFVQSTGAMSGMGDSWGTGAGFPTWCYDGTWSYHTTTYPTTGAGASDAVRDFWNTGDSTAANLRTLYQTFWADMATHYMNNQNVIFGLYNEPQVGGIEGMETIWGGEGQPTQGEGATMYRDFMQDTIDIVAAIAPYHIFMVNVPFLWDWTDALKVDRSNVVVEAHFYEVIDAADAALGTGFSQPFFLGEFGGIEEALQTEEGTEDNLQFCAANDLSWSYLSYRPANGYPSGDTWTLLEANLHPDISYYSYVADSYYVPAKMVYTGFRRR